MKRTFLRRQGESDTSKAKRKLDVEFSKMIRARDGGVCITCGKKVEGSNYHAGHFRRRECMSTRWDWRNVNGQCSGCNTFRGGLPYEYGLALDKKWGKGTAKQLYKISMKQKQWDIKEIEQLTHAARLGFNAYKQLYGELYQEGLAVDKP